MCNQNNPFKLSSSAHPSHASKPHSHTSHASHASHAPHASHVFHHVHHAHSSKSELLPFDFSVGYFLGHTERLGDEVVEHLLVGRLVIEVHDSVFGVVTVDGLVSVDHSSYLQVVDWYGVDLFGFDPPVVHSNVILDIAGSLSPLSLLIKFCQFFCLQSPYSHFIQFLFETQLKGQRNQILILGQLFEADFFFIKVQSNLKKTFSRSVLLDFKPQLFRNLLSQAHHQQYLPHNNFQPRYWIQQLKSISSLQQGKGIAISLQSDEYVTAFNEKLGYFVLFNVFEQSWKLQNGECFSMNQENVAYIQKKLVQFYEAKILFKNSKEQGFQRPQNFNAVFIESDCESFFDQFPFKIMVLLERAIFEGDLIHEVNLCEEPHTRLLGLLMQRLAFFRESSSVTFSNIKLKGLPRFILRILSFKIIRRGIQEEQKIIKSYNFIAMQVSVQTDRKKRPQLAPIGVTSALPEVQEEDEKEREKKIKKLTLINRQLIETLKRQNEELTKKINKQKLKVGKSIERVSSPQKNMQREKKELSNAYKQIEMYKTVLKDLRAKEISTESVDKLNQLQNKIRFEDATIEKLQKELKYVKNIKQQQEKELHLYQNQDVKKSIGELEEELKALKEKLKLAKKATKKRQELALKQHSYFIELEKTLRKQNDEYYPGLGAEKTKRSSLAGSSSSVDAEEITEREWQVVRAQLAELKKNHEESNKKIEQLTRLRNKEIKSSQENELRLKEKQRKLQTIKAKLEELNKLVNTQDDRKRHGGSHHEENQNGPQFEEVYENGKKVYKAKNPGNERDVKKWMIPQGYMQEKGKVLPDSIFYSDKVELKTSKKSKIIMVHVWADSAGSPSLIQFSYQNEENKIIRGLIPYSLGELQDLEDKIIEYKEGDYLAKITGRFDQGFLTNITFISKFGKKETFHAGAPGEEFKFDPRPNEIPTCFFAASIKDGRGNLRLCHIGCEFIPDW